jgi:HEPN domain-containing protein
LPTPEHFEVAGLLLEKARGDLAAARLLAADENQTDHVVGFHDQQAVEKSIKAILAASEIEIPLTHDIRYLAKLCRNSRRMSRVRVGWRMAV